MHEFFCAINQLFYTYTKTICKYMSSFLQFINYRRYRPELSAIARLILCNKSIISYIHRQCLHMHDLFCAIYQSFYISTKTVLECMSYFLQWINHVIYLPELSRNAWLLLWNKSIISYFHQDSLQMPNLFFAKNQSYYISTKTVCICMTYFVQ